MTVRSGPAWLAAYALPPIAWAGVIFWLSSRTATQAGDALGPLAGVPLVSETFHFGEYLLLAGLMFRLLAALPNRPVMYRSAMAGSGAQVRDLATANLAGLIAFGYALSDEYHQTFVAGRTFAVEDLAVDLAGIVTGVAAGWMLRSRLEPR